MTVHALDRAPTVIGILIVYNQKYPFFVRVMIAFLVSNIILIVACRLKARVVKPAETAVAREWICKQVRY
jgi:hypothetical protein